MKRFEYQAARSVKEASAHSNATVAELMTGQGKRDAAVIKAGGVDLLDLMKEGIAAPSRVVGIGGITGLDQLTYSKKDGLRIGALVTLADIEHHADVKEHYRALYEAVHHAATPQVRNMATLGGNLGQRPRCWYFRSNEHRCKKKGGDVCYAIEGQNEIHAIFDTGICPMVHASSVSTALMAFDGSVEIQGADGELRLVPLTEFFIKPAVDVTRETVLQAKDVITAVVLPAPTKGTRSFYIKQAAKESYDWALADTAVVLEMKGDRCRKARVVLGAAAPVPLRAGAVEAYLTGKTITKDTALQAGTLATKGATPLSDNAYKVPMFQAIVADCIQRV